VGGGKTGVSAQTSSMTSTFNRFKIALAMQSNCFSLERTKYWERVVSERRGVQLPGREVLATLRHGRFKIAKHVSVSSVLWCFLIFGWYQVNTTQCFILTTKSELPKARTATTSAYNVGVLVFVEYVQSGAQSPAQDSWIL
jgi:hypothetical protein